MKKYGCIFLLMISMNAGAYFDSIRNPESPGVMNGIVFSDFKNFTEKWRLVTVRYREDTKEIRLIYANPVAFEHLLRRSGQPYPDGAAFGKVAFNTDKDPAFTSSRIPSETSRYQVMIKDRTAYSESSGWGYALFDRDGKIFAEDIKSKTAACIACHQIVQSKDFVFSEMMPFSAGQTATHELPPSSALKWRQAPILGLDARFKTWAKGFTKINLLDGPVAKNYFSGTLDEIVPSLLSKTRETHLPSSLYGNADNFSAVALKGKNCLNIVIRYRGTITRNDDVCR